jgi:hypothetical protein
LLTSRSRSAHPDTDVATAAKQNRAPRVLRRFSATRLWIAVDRLKTAAAERNSGATAAALECQPTSNDSTLFCASHDADHRSVIDRDCS